MSLVGVIEDILNPADIALNGSRPWDPKIKDERFFKRVLCEGSLGLGESYMDGWWDCEKLDEFFYRLIPLNPEEVVKNNLKLKLHTFKAVIFNLASKPRAFAIGEKHYNLGNELFKKMLDKRLTYSCAYWKNTDNLDEAQEAKLDLICRKIHLKQGDRVLDIGCGWGSFAGYASEKYGVKVTGITVSREQVELARKLYSGLPVEIRLQDYRDLNEKFDHVVSIGMFEHVCYKNYRKFMEIVHSCLKDDGLFLLHTIGNSYSNVTVDPWFGKYIFPNSMIPSMRQISESIEKLFVIEDWHNFGYYYDNTLMSWFNNFDSNWDYLKELYDERFYRMWKYYLLSSAGAFRARNLHVWQIVFSKNGIKGGYEPIR
jgi:cyclopropane-fatty-acyl-phospholipid synthase